MSLSEALSQQRSGSLERPTHPLSIFRRCGSPLLPPEVAWEIRPVLPIFPPLLPFVFESRRNTGVRFVQFVAYSYN